MKQQQQQQVSIAIETNNKSFFSCFSSSDQKVPTSFPVKILCCTARWCQVSTKQKVETMPPVVGGKLQPLTDLCRLCISSKVDRFPPEALRILDESDWDLIVQLRHRNTTPQVGNGGLDGTGRLHPSISEKVLLHIEEQNPHLQKSDAADKLVWKDIVEYKFRKNVSSVRPKGLYYPWDVLVRQIVEAGETLTAILKIELDRNVTRCDIDALIAATIVLDNTAMNLDLLKETGIGKTVKKFLKIFHRDPMNESVTSFLTAKNRFQPGNLSIIQKLEDVLKKWMDMASQSGVKMDNASAAMLSKNHQPKLNDDDQYLQMAKTCHSWRELYVTIKKFDEDRRTKQGEKMRARRDRLDSIRPKIVKVRMKKHVIEEKRQAASSASSSPMSKSASKIQKLRQEASMATMRQQRQGRGRSNFSSAVASAQITNADKNLKRKIPPGKSVSLGDGKSMRVPDVKRTGNIELQKRMKMLKKNHTNLR